MRLVKVSGPKGSGTDVSKIAFQCGISDVSMQDAAKHSPNAKPQPQDIVDMKVSTPQAKAFIDALIEAPFFDREHYSIDIREPRSILKRSSTREITEPLPAPILDIDEELWQFTHVNYSFVTRVVIAALLLAYGMIHDNPLFMIGGLVFIPFMPLVLAVSFGTLTRQWQLAGHAAIAFVTATLLIALASVAVALAVDTPMMFDQFPPMAAGLFFSLAIGVAAALGTADDVGHRQLIGLAAASQLSLIPAWLGISIVHGFSESPAEKILSFGVNAVALALGAMIVYGLLSWRGELAHDTAHRKEYEL
jgi:hypothetical protein